jgi:hypothetical protein
MEDTGITTDQLIKRYELTIDRLSRDLDETRAERDTLLLATRWQPTARGPWSVSIGPKSACNIAMEQEAELITRKLAGIEPGCTTAPSQSTIDKACELARKEGQAEMSASLERAIGETGGIWPDWIYRVRRVATERDKLIAAWPEGTFTGCVWLGYSRGMLDVDREGVRDAWRVATEDLSSQEAAQPYATKRDAVRRAAGLDAPEGGGS